MKPQRIVYESHMHTTLCGHAIGEVEEYAASAEQRGMAGIVVTCHNPMPEEAFGGKTVRMREDEFQTYADWVDRAAEALAGRVEVRLGLECDYFPGYESHVEKQLGCFAFHHVLGSVHPHLPLWQSRCVDVDPRQTWRNYFQHLAEAAETHLIDTISHPDLIKNWFRDQWDPHAVMDAIESCLDRIAATGVAMELNTSGVNKSVSEMNPGRAILGQMHARNIPVVVGADEHEPGRVGDGYREAYQTLKEVGYEHVSHFLHRRRCDLPIDEALASLG